MGRDGLEEAEPVDDLLVPAARGAGDRHGELSCPAEGLKGRGAPTPGLIAADEDGRRKASMLRIDRPARRRGFNGFVPLATFPAVTSKARTARDNMPRHASGRRSTRLRRRRDGPGGMRAGEDRGAKAGRRTAPRRRALLRALLRMS